MRYWKGVALLSIFGLSLVATGCDTSTESGQLEDVNWKLTRLSGMSLAADSENGPGLTFRSADGQMAGSTGCNQIGGGYIVDGESINLGQIWTTLIGCRQQVADIEQAFLANLERVEIWDVDGRTLELYDSRRKFLMRFEAEAGA